MEGEEDDEEAVGGDGEPNLGTIEPAAHLLPRGRVAELPPAPPTRSHPGRPRWPETCSSVSNRPDRAWQPGPKARCLPTTCGCRLTQQKKQKKKKRKGEEARNSTCPSPTSMVSQSRLSSRRTGQQPTLVVLVTRSPPPADAG